MSDKPHPKGKGSWYLTTIVVCPPCGWERVYRERITDRPKPNDARERVEVIESGCVSCFL